MQMLTIMPVLKRSVLVLLLLLAIAWGKASPSVAQSNPCIAADTLSSSRLSVLVPLLSSSDSAHAALRSMLSLPQASADSVMLTTADSLCQVAMWAMDSLAVSRGQTPPTTRSFYLYRLGSAFAVEDVTTAGLLAPSGDRVVTFFSSSWAYLGGTLYPPWRIPRP